VPLTSYATLFTKGCSNVCQAGDDGRVCILAESTSSSCVSGIKTTCCTTDKCNSAPNQAVNRSIMTVGLLGVSMVLNSFFN